MVNCLTIKETIQWRISLEDKERSSNNKGGNRLPVDRTTPSKTSKSEFVM